MRNSIYKALTATLFLFSLSSYAGVFVEPYLGFQVGNYEDGTYKESANGFTMGGRGGYKMDSFFGGLELQLTAFDVDSPLKENHELNEWGFFAGVDILGTPIRTWMTFSVLGFDSTETRGRYSGNALKIGMGYIPINIFSLNLEYKMSTFGKTKKNGVESDLEPKTKIDTLILTASFWFEGIL